MLLLLGLLLLTVVGHRERELYVWYLDFQEQLFTQAAPAGWTQTELDRASAAFAGAREAVRDGRATPEELADLWMVFLRVARTAPGQPADAAAALEVIRALERVAGTRPQPTRDRDAPLASSAPRGSRSRA